MTEDGLEKCLEKTILLMLRSKEEAVRLKAVECGTRLLAIRAKLRDPDEHEGSFFEKNRRSKQ